MKNLRDYDKLTVQEKRRLTPWASKYLAKQHRRRQQVMTAQRQVENDYIEEQENEYVPDRI